MIDFKEYKNHPMFQPLFPDAEDCINEMVERINPIVDEWMAFCEKRGSLYPNMMQTELIEKGYIGL